MMLHVNEYIKFLIKMCKKDVVNNMFFLDDLTYLQFEDKFLLLKTNYSKKNGKGYLINMITVTKDLNIEVNVNNMISVHDFVSLKEQKRYCNLMISLEKFYLLDKIKEAEELPKKNKKRL